MDALTRWLMYILCAYVTVVVVLVGVGFLVGWLTRPLWRRTQAAIDAALDDNPFDDGPVDECDTGADDDLTAVLDIIRDDTPTREIDMSRFEAQFRPAPITRIIRRPRNYLYINREDR